VCGADKVLVAKAQRRTTALASCTRAKSQGDFANALSHLHKSIEIRNYIARTYEKQGDAERALAEHANSLEIRLGVFGA